MYDSLSILFSDYTFRLIFWGTTLLGALSGIVGVFALLRKQALLGDTISHAAFPGIAYAFLITYSKNPYILLAGGAISGLCGTVLVFVITRFSSLKHDAALGIILSVFFGMGLVLLTHIQKLSISHQSVLNKFLFGNAAILLPEDCWIIFLIALVCISLLYCIKRPIFIIAFDPSYAAVMGILRTQFDMLLAVLLVLTIVVGLQAVGVVLMSSLLVAPAAAARQWTYKFHTLLFLSGLFGAVSSALGTIISCYYNIPTGPVIVIVMSMFVFISLLVAPSHGILWRMRLAGDS